MGLLCGYPDDGLSSFGQIDLLEESEKNTFAK